MIKKKIAVVVRHTTQQMKPNIPIDEPLSNFDNTHVTNLAVYLNRYIDNIVVEFFYFTLQKKYFFKMYKGIKVHFCPVHLFKLKYGKETSFTLFSKIKEFNPDFIYTFNYAGLNFMQLLLWAKYLKIPIITTHTSSVSWYKRPRNPLKILRYYLVNYLMRKYLDGIIIWGHKPVLDFFKKEIKFPPEKIYETTWIGTDHNFFKPGNKKESRFKLGLNDDNIYILNICILIPPPTPKSQFHLVDIMKELSKFRDIAKIKCILTGSKRHLKGQFLEYASSKGVEDNFILYDFVPNETLLNIYHASDFYINLSYKDSGLHKESALERETPIIESAAVRLPILSFANVDKTENDGRMLYIPKGNYREMAYQLHKLIDDNKMIEQLKDNAYKDFIEHATWEAVSKNVYNNIILPIIKKYESKY